MSINNATPAAYELYLEGQKLFSIIKRDSLEAAADKFRQAKEESPGFARAWGYLSYCLSQLVVAGHIAPGVQADASMSEAESCARQAVSLDGDDYANHWDLAFALLNQGKTAEAFTAYDIALDRFDHRADKLDRRNDLLVEMAEAYVYSGDLNRAFELLDRAIRVPDWYRWIRAWACFNARDYQGAIDQITAMHKPPTDPNYVPDIQLLLAAAYSCNGQDSAATTALQQLKARRPDWTIDRELARNPFAKETDREHWESAMRKAGFT